MNAKITDTADVARLLGPTDPEVGCETCFELVDHYVDLELAGGDVDAALPGVRVHLAGCPVCRDEHDSLYALMAGMRRS